MTPGELKTFGWFKAVEEGRLTKAKVNEICRTVLYYNAKSYMLGANSDEFRTRFKHSAFSELGLDQRSRGYQIKQMKAFGATRPYLSPTKGVTVHMCDLMNVEGPMGYQIFSTSTSSRIELKITLPGARMLNAGKSKNKQQYLDQFMGWEGGARFQAKKIVENSLSDIEGAILREAGEADKAKEETKKNKAAYDASPAGMAARQEKNKRMAGARWLRKNGI
jgi:hypothetical protein